MTETEQGGHDNERADWLEVGRALHVGFRGSEAGLWRWMQWGIASMLTFNSDEYAERWSRFDLERIAPSPQTDMFDAPVAPNVMERVYEFNRIGQVPPPNGFNADRICFYTGMQLEELGEKIDAIAGGEVETSARMALRDLALELQRAGHEFKAGKHMGAVLRANRKDLLDADIDVTVVTIGSMTYQTKKFREATAHVLDRNDAKFVNGVAIRDANGKIQKPEGWTPPDLEPFIENPID